MAYKFSKGSQVIGDLKAADDTQRDTLIDFGEDRIDFQTSGSTRLTIENNVITTTTTLHISGSDGQYLSPYPSEALIIGKRDDKYAEIQFENNGVDAAFIQLNNTEGLVIGCQSNQDAITFYTNNGSVTEAMRITHDNRLGINTNNPDTTLHVEGDTTLNGRTIIQATGSETPSELLSNESISFYLDEDANELKVRVKYSDGQLKTGTIGLS